MPGITPVQMLAPGQPGITPVQIVDQFGSAIQSSIYPASAFGATGNGSTDDTAAINAAIVAAGVTGGIVLLGPGTYRTSASILLPTDRVILRGSGWNTIIKPVAGAQFDAIATPIPGSAGLAGFTRNYLGIEQLMIDCSQMTGTTAGQGNAIHFYGVRYSYIRDVLIQSSPNWAILLDGDNTGSQNFGYDIQVMRCVFDLCNANVYQTNCEANDYVENRFKWCGLATAALQPALGAQDTNTNHLRLSSGYAYIAGNVFGKGGTYTSASILCSNSGPTRMIGNRFDQVRAQAVTMNAGNHEFIGNALGSPCSAALGNPAIQLGNSNNRVIGNSWDNTAGSTHHTYCVAEAGGPFTNNLISGNNFIQGVTGNGFVNLNATSTARVYGNGGYNPVGSVTPPAVPASTVAQTNNFGVDMSVFVNAGTVTVVAIGGVTTGQIGGMFRVPAGQTITLTYSVAPTWVWFGD